MGADCFSCDPAPIQRQQAECRQYQVMKAIEESTGRNRGRYVVDLAQYFEGSSRMWNGKKGSHSKTGPKSKEFISDSDDHLDERGVSGNGKLKADVGRAGEKGEEHSKGEGECFKLEGTSCEGEEVNSDRGGGGDNEGSGTNEHKSSEECDMVDEPISSGHEHAGYKGRSPKEEGLGGGNSENADANKSSKRELRHKRTIKDREDSSLLSLLSYGSDVEVLSDEVSLSDIDMADPSKKAKVSNAEVESTTRSGSSSSRPDSNAVDMPTPSKRKSLSLETGSWHVSRAEFGIEKRGESTSSVSLVEDLGKKSKSKKRVTASRRSWSSYNDSRRERDSMSDAFEVTSSSDEIGAKEEAEPDDKEGIVSGKKKKKRKKVHKSLFSSDSDDDSDEGGVSGNGKLKGDVGGAGGKGEEHSERKGEFFKLEGTSGEGEEVNSDREVGGGDNEGSGTNEHKSSEECDMVDEPISSGHEHAGYKRRSPKEEGLGGGNSENADANKSYKRELCHKRTIKDREDSSLLSLLSYGSDVEVLSDEVSLSDIDMADPSKKAKVSDAEVESTTKSGFSSSRPDSDTVDMPTPSKRKSLSLETGSWRVSRVEFGIENKEGIVSGKKKKKRKKVHKSLFSSDKDSDYKRNLNAVLTSSKDGLLTLEEHLSESQSANKVKFPLNYARSDSVTGSAIMPSPQKRKRKRIISISSESEEKSHYINLDKESDSGFEERGTTQGRNNWLSSRKKRKRRLFSFNNSSPSGGSNSEEEGEVGIKVKKEENTSNRDKEEKGNTTTAGRRYMYMYLYRIPGIFCGVKLLWFSWL